MLKIYQVPDYTQDCKGCKCSGPLQRWVLTCLSCAGFVDILPTRVLGLHCAIAPVLTLLLAHCPLLLSDKKSAVGSLGLDLGLGFLFACLVLEVFCLLAFGVFFGGFFAFFCETSR